MATVATRPGENLVEQKPKRIHLTPTCLLMEGDYINYVICTIIGAVYDCRTVQSWDGLRLGLLSHGYSRVLFFETHCPQDGIWRIGIAEEQEIYACPKSSAA